MSKDGGSTKDIKRHQNKDILRSIYKLSSIEKESKKDALIV